MTHKKFLIPAESFDGIANSRNSMRLKLNIPEVTYVVCREETVQHSVLTSLTIQCDKKNKMSTKYKVLLTMVAFSMGLICQYMYMGQSEVKMIVTGTNQGQVFTEKVFYKDNYHHTLYRPRFSTRLCGLNMTYIDFGDTFTSTQIARVNRCISTYEQEYQKGLKEERIKRDVRWSSHTYINNKSFMIEAGGHNGVDVEQFNSRFHPGKYVVLEPVERFFNVLKTKFKGSPNVVVYKFGVDATDGIFYVNDAKNDGSSIFHKDESAS
ncbi:hypothetical protein KP79_PYT22579 [Mizuhopecten yessoensis]|uniref:Methyltransferase FkbM domain-containing protein n=1 Tax=Mizuhopecten yessoensis TaxID=6573 RepID=A0A210Q279_MIZYE|nr:hypothetical protein KP79_PYT22579 [Mizuhopecten yessoensis]